MADQDFYINIRTTADLAGLKRLEAELAALKGRLAASGGGGGGGALPPLEPEKAGKDIAEHIGRGFSRVALHAIGVGAVFEMINAIKQTAEEINKITDALDKQGELLVQNSRHLMQQSKFAQTDADVLKIAEEGMKNIAEAHKVVEDLLKKELTWEQQLADLQAKTAPGGGKGVNQALLDLEREQAERNEASAKQSAMFALATAETEKVKLETQAYSKSVEELTNKLTEQEQKRDTAFLKGEIQDYLEAGEAAKEYKRQLEDLKVAHDKLTDKTKKFIETADPQVQAILKNEAAMRQARAEGREQDAAMFERTAQAFRRGATPAQLAEVAKIYGGKEVVDAIKEMSRNQRELIDLWK